MQITWYGHSAFRLDFGGNAVLIDPFFTGNPAFVSDKAEAIKDVSQIVLTHGHALATRSRSPSRTAPPSQPIMIFACGSPARA
jgi:hypothetical protein